MTVIDRPRTELVAGHASTPPVVREIPAQRDLVALSLLLCPDSHAPRDPRS